MVVSSTQCQSKRVLLVSKPLVPPWNDSGRNWARDIARYASAQGTIKHHVLVPRGNPMAARWPHVIAEPVYADERIRKGRFSPRKLDNARALGRLLQRCPCEIVHFCFAPNPRSNLLARLAMKRRKQPSMHTILSVPARFGGIERVLFAQTLVCVSRSTADKLVEAGVQGRVELIKAAIPLHKPLQDADPHGRIAALETSLGLEPGRPLVVFPGDYEFSQAADVFAGAVEELWQHCDADFLFACRIKQPASLAREAEIKKRLEAPLQAGRVFFHRQIDDMQALLARASVVTLPSESTYAKMDLPLVVLEALAERTPVVLANVAPLRECLGDKPAEAGGVLVPPLDATSLARALKDLLKDTKATAQLGALGRKHVEAHHDVQNNCRRYAALYEDMLRS